MMTFKLEVDVHVAGMDALIAAIRGDISPEDKAVLDRLLKTSASLVRKLERLDAKTPNT